MRSSNRDLPVHPYLLLTVSILAVAVSSIMIKSSATPPSVAGMYRLFITVCILLPFVPWTSIRTLSLSLKEWIIVLSAGAALGLHFLFWMESLSYTSVASSLVILTLQPFFVMVGAYFLFKERITVRITLCMLTAIAGSVVIAWGDIGVSRQALIGDGLSLLGTIAISLYLLAGQRVSRRIPANLYSVIVFAVGGTVMLIYSAVRHYPLIGYAPSDWVYFVLLAVIPTVFGHFIFNLLLRSIGATAVSVGVIGEPVLATILAYFILGEALGGSQLTGGVLTLLGMGTYFWLKASRKSHSLRA
ncbi:DMT family transporter [Paenibacillus tarimensis]|uniref:DMT family transporter n=1 Tax=Paenibacillus tarimensis TaxID=416012 RepID=UPI001F442003|nr:DMT family transporter [Paenibacillus tarimensis]MCF2945248.1 DMT family transporter [Paenibacillus tarimensis]